MNSISHPFLFLLFLVFSITVLRSVRGDANANADADAFSVPANENDNDADTTNATGKANQSSTIDSSLATTIRDDKDDDSLVIGNNETFFNGDGGGDESDDMIVPYSGTTASNLDWLLEKHNLTTLALAKMYLGTYFPTNPRDSDQYPDYWKAEVVTPIAQGVNGSLVQAVLFSNEYRSPHNPQRVLSFAGVMTNYLAKTMNPESACLAANYGFKGTGAEGAWQKSCLENGYLLPNMTEWAAQAGALVESTGATFLTGHKLGCEFAKSEALLNPHIPAVCWSATGTLTEAWIDAYPGLSEVARTKNHYAETTETTNEKNKTTTTNTSTNTTTIDANGNTVLSFPQNDAMVSYPDNDQIYVIQTYTDPTSNCLLPLPQHGWGLAHVCAYPSTSRCDAFNGAPGFDYDYFSKCSQWSSSTLGNFRNLPETFDPRDCIPREDVGLDIGLRDCPYQQILVDGVPLDEDFVVYESSSSSSSTTETSSASETASWTTSTADSGGRQHHNHRLVTPVSLLLVAILLMRQ